MTFIKMLNSLRSSLDLILIGICFQRPDRDSFVDTLCDFINPKFIIICGPT